MAGGSGERGRVSTDATGEGLQEEGLTTEGVNHRLHSLTVESKEWDKKLAGLAQHPIET